MVGGRGSDGEVRRGVGGGGGGGGGGGRGRRLKREGIGEKRRWLLIPHSIM